MTGHPQTVAQFDIVHERFAIALAIRDDAGRFIFGLRRDDESEYRNRWSLPSLSVTEDEYTEIVSGVALPLSLLSGRRFDRLGLRAPADILFLRKCERYRADYHLRLALLGGRATGADANSLKYSALELLHLDEVLRRMRYEVGSCVSLLLEELYVTGRADYSQSVIELPPELADSERELQSYSQDELWALCAANYEVLVGGTGGGDGHIKRFHALEPAITRFAEALPTGCRVADLGCGDGRLVQRLRAAGHHATGLDITQAAPQSLLEEGVVRHGRIEDLDSFYQPESLDVAMLSLVCQWIGELEMVLAGLARALVPWGRAVVVLVAPEFAKAGNWEFGVSPPHFILSKPYRREPCLTMINRGVGPLWHYPRTIPEYIGLFGSAGFGCVQAEYLYLDSFESQASVKNLISERPYLLNNVVAPCFLWLEFLRLPEHLSQKDLSDGHQSPVAGS